MNYEDIEEKHKELIDIALNKYLNKINNDFEHDLGHTYDVVEYLKKLLNVVDLNVNKEVCIIGAYWHDVGRTVCDIGHEQVSADLLKNEMIKLGYKDDFCKECYYSVLNHKWNDIPKTDEGLLIRDADKIAFLGPRRWKACLDNNQSLEEIINLLPELRNKYLYLKESRIIYDEEIVKILKMVYNKNR